MIRSEDIEKSIASISRLNNCRTLDILLVWSLSRQNSCWGWSTRTPPCIIVWCHLFVHLHYYYPYNKETREAIQCLRNLTWEIGFHLRATMNVWDMFAKSLFIEKYDIHFTVSILLAYTVMKRERSRRNFYAFRNKRGTQKVRENICYSQTSALSQGSGTKSQYPST